MKNFVSRVKNEKPLNLCILTQDEDNKSCEYLKQAMEEKGHNVTLLQYANERASDPSKNWDINHDTGELTRGDEKLNVQDFDGMMVRSWGTAPVAAKHSPVFERFGVVIANDIEKTIKSNSKVETTRIFKEHDVPMPDTEAYYFNELQEEEIKEKVKDFFKGKSKIALKPSYGARGENVRFYEDADEAVERIKEIKSQPNQNGFLIQDFVDTSKGKEAESYRIFVMGGEAKLGIHLTAKSTDKPVTHVHQGGVPELLDKEHLERYGRYARKAAKVMDMGSVVQQLIC